MIGYDPWSHTRILPVNESAYTLLVTLLFLHGKSPSPVARMYSFSLIISAMFPARVSSDYHLSILFRLPFKPFVAR